MWGAPSGTGPERGQGGQEWAGSSGWRWDVTGRCSMAPCVLPATGTGKGMTVCVSFYKLT